MGGGARLNLPRHLALSFALSLVVWHELGVRACIVFLRVVVVGDWVVVVSVTVVVSVAVVVGVVVLVGGTVVLLCAAAYCSCSRCCQ